MHVQPSARMPKRIVRFNCGRYFVRTIRREDVSDRWVSWLSDPWAIRALNLPRRPSQKKDVIDYMKRFDQDREPAVRKSKQQAVK